MSEPITVLIVDDQPIVRSAFATILNGYDDIDVVGEAGDGEDAIRLTRALHPDVVLMDIRMPRLDGIAATRELAGHGSPHPTRVLILTTFDLDEYVYQALRAGASGFVLKDATRDELVYSVRAVARGDVLLSPKVTRRLVSDFLHRAPTTRWQTELASLTQREREVLLHLARGRSNAEIASSMFLGETTVKTHVGHVLMKLGVRDRVQAVIVAFEHGLVTPGDD